MFPRFNVLGVGVHAVNLRQVLTFLLNAADEKHTGCVCLGNPETILLARKDEAVRDILNNSLLTIPDGSATVSVGHAYGYHCLAPFSAEDLILRLCRLSAPHRLKHFFYGCHDLSQWQTELLKRCAGLQVAGTAVHPGRALTLKEEADLLSQVRDSEPDFFWVGLDSPEQEKFMANYSERMNTIMIGIGPRLEAPLPENAVEERRGRVPNWQTAARNVGMRYLVEYPQFAALLMAQMFGLMQYDVPHKAAASTTTRQLPRAA